MLRGRSVGRGEGNQGSRPVVAPDGTLYVFWDGSTRLASLNSTYVVKSTDGGATWSKPKAVSELTDQMVLADTVFRVNSFPAAAVAPDGDLYATWTTETKASNEKLDGDRGCASWLTDDLAGCESDAVWSKSTHPINTRNGFGGGFIGDYTDLSVGSDGTVHALWTDTNNKQTVAWWYGLEFVPTMINQEDVVVWNGTL